MFSIEEVNSLSKDKFLEVFGNIVECYPQAAAEVCNLRPFQDEQELADAVGNLLDAMTLLEKEVVLKLHPDLAGRLADEGKLTAESTAEQRSAGLDNLTADDKVNMTQLNERYRAKFGFPFVVCARENKTSAILQGLAQRLSNTREVELHQGIAEVKQICRLRIKELLAAQ